MLTLHVNVTWLSNRRRPWEKPKVWLDAQIKFQASFLHFGRDKMKDDMKLLTVSHCWPSGWSLSSLPFHRALSKSSLRSYHIALNFALLASLCLPWQSTLALLVVLVQETQPSPSIPPPHSEVLHLPTLPPPQSMFPEALFLNGMARLSGCLHCVWWEPAWSRVLRGLVLWPLSRCWACQDLQALPVNMRVPGSAEEGADGWRRRWGRKNRGERRERAGSKDGKQAVGFWDHFALTHTPPFCSECLNMRTTQLLLTPALPLKRSSDD